ncbi:hypothetical protein [Terasakiella sp.]|uniref:hypothetical protein n=1 Tax=Terasakiella sp. TaxID=2034861 RepID=UPI003AA9A3E2
MKPDTVKPSVKKPDCECEGTNERPRAEELAVYLLQLNPMQKQAAFALMLNLALKGDKRLREVEDDHGIQYFDESGKLWGTMTLKDKKAPIWQKADALD